MAYTTHSSDQRGLGDIGVVAVLGGQGDGDELWSLAHDLGGRAQAQDQARWILTQASRARMVKSDDRPDVMWTAYIRRRFELDALFTNHDVLMTGRIRLGGTSAAPGEAADDRLQVVRVWTDQVE
ncbi:hypothetical protein [Streptomyces sp. NPDC018957]|uniref:hypothetical protein n=1 Tax=Streptomyces sp. NPDC018957 TaxID=3365056 RepID=UPI0037B88FA8